MMNPIELTQLMHAVLDGEAGPGEAVELERELAANPSARAEFDQLERLFAGLAGVPQAFRPGGLGAGVMAGLTRQSRRRSRLVQLFMPTRVIRSTSEEARVQNPGNLTTAH